MTAGSILWFLAIGALVYFMMKKGAGCGGSHDHGGGCCGGHDHGGHDGHQDNHVSEQRNGVQSGDHLAEERLEDASLKDPVCGMEVNKDSASLSSEHLGKTFHFCSEHCRKLFDLHPGKYIPSVHG